MDQMSNKCNDFTMICVVFVRVTTVITFLSRKYISTFNFNISSDMKVNLVDALRDDQKQKNPQYFS